MLLSCSRYVCPALRANPPPTTGRDVLVSVVPVGVVTLITSGSFGSVEHSMRYPGGRKVLKPDINSGCPLNNIDTRSITPGVSILLRRQFPDGGKIHCPHAHTHTYDWLLKSFIISRNRLYTSGCEENCTLTWSRYVSASLTFSGRYPPLLPLLLEGVCGTVCCCLVL